MLVDKIIKLLGGVSHEEYSLLNIQYESQRIIVEQYRAREVILTEEIKSEREERKQLQEIIFKNYGVIHSENTSQIEESIQPIRTSPRRWSGLKSSLEKDDRDRVRGNSDAKVS